MIEIHYIVYLDYLINNPSFISYSKLVALSLVDKFVFLSINPSLFIVVPKLFNLFFLISGILFIVKLF